MRFWILLWFLVVGYPLAYAQLDSNFRIEVSCDSVLFGHYISVMFTIENVQGEFELPDLPSFEIIGGPNQSTSMQIMNGITSQTIRYTYYLKPTDEGPLTIYPAYLTTNDGTVLETKPIHIRVWPNPENIPQKSQEDPFSRNKSDFRSFFSPEEFMPSQPGPSPKKKKPLKVIKTWCEYS